MDNDSNMIRIGPSSSSTNRGSPWDEKGRDKIVQIFVSHGDEINSIQFQYAQNGVLLLSERHGSIDNDGNYFDVVKLNHPGEYITCVSGHKSAYDLLLSSIKLGTNRGEYGPFGRFRDSDEEFSFKLGEDGQFGGFYGTADTNCVRSIGVYLKPNTTLDCSVNSITVRMLSKLHE